MADSLAPGDPVAVEVWEGSGVHLSEVSAALAGLRHRHGGDRTARTAVMTLIAVVPDEASRAAATRALRSLGRHHPARILVLRPEPDQAASLDARAALYTLGPDAHGTTFEELTLTVGGQAARHLDSIVRPFTVADLPVALWYVGSVPEAHDPLLSPATVVLVDSRDAGDPGRFRSLLELARRRTVADLSWIRLRPWRVLLAGMFDDPDCAGWLSSVETAEVAGKTGPRRILGGWLSAQLALLPRQVLLRDARHVEVRLACFREGRRARFQVARTAGAKEVFARAALPEGELPERVHPLAEDPLAASLAEALTALAPDPVWERALSSATLLGA